VLTFYMISGFETDWIVYKIKTYRDGNVCEIEPVF